MASASAGLDLVARREPAQNRLHALDEEALRKRLPDEIVGAHLEAEQFVDLLVLRGQEDHRQIGFLAQAAQQFHAVHARHLDVEDGEIRRGMLQPVEGRGPVRVGLDPVALGFERDGNRGQDVAIVVDESDRWHEHFLAAERGWPLECRGLV